VPGNAALEAGKKLTIKAVGYIPVPDQDLLIVPLVLGKAKDIPVIRAVPLDNRHIVRWELGSPGSLELNGNSAVLTAPATVTGGSGAAVSLEIKSPGTIKRLLVSNITYVSDQYLMVRFGGEEWMPYFGVLSNIQGKYYSISGMVNPSDQTVPLVIMWTKGEGMHNWTDVHERTNFVDFQYAYPPRATSPNSMRRLRMLLCQAVDR
jgi:hypothetical protein